MDELPLVPQEVRARLLERFGDPAVHEHALRTLRALGTVEIRRAEVPAPALGRTVRIAVWNAERGTSLDGAVELLARTRADVNLLCELDVGMARSGQRHTPREIAGRLGHGYAFAVEFLELGLGNRQERAALDGDGAGNDRGLHGAAVTTAVELRRPQLIRFDRSGVWFTDGRDEPRVGGRMAVAATLPWQDRELVVACAHLESHGDPDGRAAQTAALLDALDEYAEGRPVVLGGDLNTQSAAAVEVYRSTVRRAMVEETPSRFVDPVPYEPLFEEAARRGYEWRDANAPGPTQRTRPAGYPKPPLMRLDWFLARGVRASDPATVPALGTGGAAISDHDLLAVTIEPG